MKYRIITFIVLAFAGALVVGWDIVLAVKHRDGAETISTLTLNAVRGQPWAMIILVIAIGVLLGHLLWPQLRSS